MNLKWEQHSSWFDRSFWVEYDDGSVVTDLGPNPTLDELRKIERREGNRLNLWQVGLICTVCGEAINDRFGADEKGELLCWNCAQNASPEDSGEIISNTDPTPAILSESNLYKKSLCDYVINVATGCRHGCKFCYVPSTRGLKGREKDVKDKTAITDLQEDWGDYLLYRDDLPERLHQELKDTSSDEWGITERGRGVTMLSSGTDCYQDRRASQITRGCLHELVENNRPIRILTRSPAVVRDIDLFKKNTDLITVGSSIPTMDDELAKVIEPNAPPISTRWKALDELRKQGVRTFISMSPTYPTMDKDDIWETLTYLKCLEPEVVFHEPINPRGANIEMCVKAAQEAGRDNLASELEKLKEHSAWVNYALEQINLVQKVAKEIGGLDIHSWPDQRLIQSTSGELRFQLMEMKQSVSPETFDGQKSEPSKSQSPLGEDIESLQTKIRG